MAAPGAGAPGRQAWREHPSRDRVAKPHRQAPHQVAAEVREAATAALVAFGGE